MLEWRFSFANPNGRWAMRDSQHDQQQHYLDSLFGHEDVQATRIRASAPEKLAGMMLSAHEAALLAWLARSINAHTILEIGSFVGYSAQALLQALPADGVLHCIESDPHHAAQIRENLEAPLANHRLCLHEGAALDVLPNLEKHAPYDLIFIDADKRNYPAYAEWSARNLRPGALLVADNTLNFGSVDVSSPTPPESKSSQAGWEAMRALNAHLADDAAWDTTLLPTAGGMTVARKR
jgi:caffeoyl-CoA O-methyltransferase